jgi:hypothetical protein
VGGWRGVLVLAVVCASGCAGPGAAPEPETVTMDGTLIAPEGGVARLCSVVMESYPPQCGEGVLVEGLDLADVPGVQRASGVTFGELRLTGVLRDGVLTVTAPPEAL